MIEFLKDLFKNEEPPTDVEISWRGQKVLANFIDENGQAQKLTAKDIYDIQRAQGYDVAAWVLYKALRDNPTFQNFSSFVEERKDRYAPRNKDITVVILTHNPWVSEKENQDYQWRLKNIAADGGFDYAVPEIPYRRSLFANAYRYQEYLKRFEGRKVIFLTHSLAGLELRWLLEKSQKLNIDLVGWLNLSGLIYGTSLPPSSNDWFFSAQRYLYNSHPVLPEVSRSNSYCYKDLNIPKDLPLVSVVGFSPSKHFNLAEARRNREMKFWGPHDGFVTLADYLNAPGVVWPIWHEGHYIQVEGYKSRLQAALHYLCAEADILRNAAIQSELKLDFITSPQR